MPSIKLYPSVITTVLAWTNPNNAKLDDGVYATTGGTRNSNHDLIASSFSHSIPAGATINSVTVEVQYKLSTAASASTLTLQAQKSGVLSGTARAITTEPLTDTVLTNANTGTWSVADLANAQVLFRVRRTSNTACTYSVDYIAISVDYTIVVEGKIGTFVSEIGEKIITSSIKRNTLTVTTACGDIVTVSSYKTGKYVIAQSLGGLVTAQSFKSAFSPTLTSSDGDEIVIEGTIATGGSYVSSNGEVITITARKTTPATYTTEVGEVHTFTSKGSHFTTILSANGGYTLIASVEDARYATTSSQGDEISLFSKRNNDLSTLSDNGSFSAYVASKAIDGYFDSLIGELFLPAYYKGGENDLFSSQGDLININSSGGYFGVASFETGAEITVSGIIGLQITLFSTLQITSSSQGNKIIIENYLSENTDENNLIAEKQSFLEFESSNGIEETNIKTQQDFLGEFSELIETESILITKKQSFFEFESSNGVIDFVGASNSGQGSYLSENASVFNLAVFKNSYVNLTESLATLENFSLQPSKLSSVFSSNKDESIISIEKASFEKYDSPTGSFINLTLKSRRYFGLVGSIGASSETQYSRNTSILFNEFIGSLSEVESTKKVPSVFINSYGDFNEFIAIGQKILNLIDFNGSVFEISWQKWAENFYVYADTIYAKSSIKGPIQLTAVKKDSIKTELIPRESILIEEKIKPAISIIAISRKPIQMVAVQSNTIKIIARISRVWGE